ncbi:hypothetical protein ABR737_01415 [Streptomyces sp. Edi2]|uniref:hypothetical protein n=1 Tax=Streptomyces sp. Edi2 TaxID=3162528 RepID=UPI0033058939
MLGLTDGAAPVYLGPAAGHTLLVAWPGLGATMALRTLAAQYARRGMHVDVLDVAGQHTWARDQRRIHLYGDATAVHRHLYHLAAQVRGQRSGAPRVVVVESDLTINALLRFRHYPFPGGTGLDALTAVLGAGRLYGIRVVLACRAVPIPLAHVARSLFTTRLLAAPTPRTWHLVGTPGAAPPQDEPFRAGQMHLISSSGDSPVQLLQLTGLQAAQLASTQAPAPADGLTRPLRRAKGRPPAAAPAASTFQMPRTQGD